MKNLKLKMGVMDIVLVLVSLAFLLGMIFIFGPCGPKEDGSVMSCHWAGSSVTGLACVLLVISVIRMFVPGEQIKLGLSLAVIPIAILAGLIPGKIIDVCMMPGMHCRAVMTPAVIVFSALTTIIAVGGAIRSRGGKA